MTLSKNGEVYAQITLNFSPLCEVLENSKSEKIKVCENACEEKRKKKTINTYRNI